MNPTEGQKSLKQSRGMQTLEQGPALAGFKALHNLLRTAAGLVLAVSLLAPAARAQSTAQMHGTVADSSGAAVPGAQVKAT